MIFNNNKKCFEHSEEELQNYIDNISSNHFNKTQITTIVSAVSDTIDNILDLYKDSLGDGILLLNILLNEKDLAGLTSKGDKCSAIGGWLVYSSNQNNRLITKLADLAPNLYHSGKGDKSTIRCLKLGTHGKNNGWQEEDQRSEIQKITKDLLRESIKDVENSNIYILKKSKGELFFERDLFIKYVKDWVDDIEGNNQCLTRSLSA